MAQSDIEKVEDSFAQDPDVHKSESWPGDVRLGVTQRAGRCWSTP
jgi:hypothetical protein